MKNLISSTAQVFKLSFVIVLLTSATVFAGGNEDGATDKKNNASTYAVALSDMEKALNEAENSKKIYTPVSQVKIYDADFNLIQQASIPEDGIVEDKELLKLMRQSNELMRLDHITYYVLNN